MGMMFASTEVNTYYGNTSSGVFMSPQQRLVEAFGAGLHFVEDFPLVIIPSKEPHFLGHSRRSLP